MADHILNCELINSINIYMGQGKTPDPVSRPQRVNNKHYIFVYLIQLVNNSSLHIT